MQKIVEEMGDINPTITPQETENFKIKFERIIVNKPKIVEADGSKRNIFPIEARMRKITYAAPIELEVSTTIDNVQREKFTTDVGFLPIMVKSKFCHLSGLKDEEDLIKEGEDPHDLGGYFILNGNERVLIIVEDLAPNKIFFQGNKSGPSKYTAKVYSEQGPYRIPHTIEQMKDGIIYISFTRFKRVPIIAVIKALGLVKDQEITHFITEESSDDLFINLYNSIELKTEEDALESLAKKIGINKITAKMMSPVKENKEYALAKEDTSELRKILLELKNPKDEVAITNNFEDILNLTSKKNFIEKKPKWSVEYFSNFAGTKKKIRCYIGYYFAQIDLSGDVTLCCINRRFIVGNIHKKSFFDVWDSKQANDFRLKAKYEIDLNGRKWKDCNHCLQWKFLLSLNERAEEYKKNL